MRFFGRSVARTGFVWVILTLILPAQWTWAASTSEIDTKVAFALKKLYDTTPSARELAKVAKGILVFPEIDKGGLIIGCQWGEGSLIKNGRTVAYYRSISASYGL